MPGAAISMTQKKMGFTTAVTTVRPPVGETWILYGAVRIGGAALQVSFTDGTTSQDYMSGSQNIRTVPITNEWYLSCAAATATTGWLLTVALGFESYSFDEA